MLELIETGDREALLMFVYIRAWIIAVTWFFAILACVIDFWSGVTTAKALGEPIASHGFRQTVTKVGDYTKVLLFALMFDVIGSLLPAYKLPFATILCMVAVLLIEGRSVIENSRRRKAHAAEIPEIVKAIIEATTHDKGKEVLRRVEEHILNELKTENVNERNKNEGI